MTTRHLSGTVLFRASLRAAVVGSLIAQVAAAGDPAPGPGRWTLSFSGLGPARIGMTVREAEKALKMKLDEDAASEPCHYAENEKELPGIGFMVLDGRIARIDVSNMTNRTVSGAGVGTTEEEIRRIYPRIEVEPNQYDPTGHTLILTSRDQQYGMVFETDGKVVTDFRAGKREPVGFVERCL